MAECHIPSGLLKGSNCNRDESLSSVLINLTLSVYGDKLELERN